MNEVEVFKIISGFLGILGFLISSFLFYFRVIEFKESRKKIKIELQWCDEGRIHKKGSHHYGFPDNLIYRNVNVNTIKNIFVYKLGYYLVNDTDKPITITDVRYVWEYPISKKGKKLKDYPLSGFEFYSKKFKDDTYRGWIKNPSDDCIINSGKRILIEDELHGSPIISRFLEQNNLRWKQYCGQICRDMGSNLEPHDFPPTYGIKIEVWDIKGRKTEKIIDNYLWGKEE